MPRVGESESTETNFDQTVELLSRMKSPNVVITVLPDEKNGLVFDMSRHSDPLIPVFCDDLVIDNLESKVKTLIEVVAGGVEYPFVVKAPVGHGMEGENGSTLFAKTQVKLALTSVIAYLRTLSAWVAAKWIQTETAKSTLVSPQNIRLVDTDQRVKALLKKARVKGAGWVFESAPELGPIALEDEAKRHAGELVRRWEQKETEIICTNLSVGILSYVHSSKSKQKREDTTLERLVIEYESLVTANQAS